MQPGVAMSSKSMRDLAHPGSTSRGAEAERLARALGEAADRAEAVLQRLDAKATEVERRLQETTAMTERSIAVALELRQDVSSLIVALQDLATEIDAQVRDHTASLMALLPGWSERRRRCASLSGRHRAWNLSETRCGLRRMALKRMRLRDPPGLLANRR